MNLSQMIEQIKSRPDYHRVGMILCHNGVVRGTSRDGKPVTQLEIKVDHERLQQIVDNARKKPGIVDVRVHINEGQKLAVGDDVMYLVVAGDIRENVSTTLMETLNTIKSTVTQKTEHFVK